MLTIKHPRLESTGTSSRLVSDIYVDGEKRTVWAEVDIKYTDYLCWERSDAFVIGLLHYAMFHGHDITCEAPIGEYLYYQITTELIDAVSKGSSRMYATKIYSEVDSSCLPCAGMVGTGISCGIDSLHALAANLDDHLTRHKVTHLAFNNVGSHGEGSRANRLFAERRKNAEMFCKEYGFELTEVNSNIMDVFEQEHYLTHTYTSMFAVFVLQKLYSVYYYASGRPFSEFSLTDNDYFPPDFYELLLLQDFSTENLKIYSEGGTLTRLEKTRKVVDYFPSYKYLNVCVSTSGNCGRCEKCIRTLLALDVLGKLDEYSAVFDVEYYRSHKQWYLKRLLIEKAANHFEYLELYPYLKSQIMFSTYLKAIPKSCMRWLYAKMPKGKLRDFLHAQALRFLKK